jgi:hypothetical protein
VNDSRPAAHGHPDDRGEHAENRTVRRLPSTPARQSHIGLEGSMVSTYAVAIFAALFSACCALTLFRTINRFDPQ